MDPNMQPMAPDPSSVYGGVPKSGGGLKLVFYVLIGFMAFFALIAVLLSLGGTNEDIARLSAQQTELVRVASLGTSDTVASPGTKNIATTISLTATSYVTQLSNFESISEVTDELIEEFKDENADSLLEAAKKTNNFDKKYIDIMNILIDSTVDGLATIDTSGLSESELAIIQSMRDDYQLLADSF